MQRARSSSGGPGARVAGFVFVLLIAVAPALGACPGDVDADGTVGFGDLLGVLAAWGPCSACPQDTNGSGAVDFADVLVVLGGWGPCPVGPCCMCNGQCFDMTQAGCAASGGFYQGDGISCVQVECAICFGACCFTDGSCASLTEPTCFAAGGDYQGNFVACEEVVCPDPP